MLRPATSSSAALASPSRTPSASTTCPLRETKPHHQHEGPAMTTSEAVQVLAMTSSVRIREHPPPWRLGDATAAALLARAGAGYALTGHPSDQERVSSPRTDPPLSG